MFSEEEVCGRKQRCLCGGKVSVCVKGVGVRVFRGNENLWEEGRTCMRDGERGVLYMCAEGAWG